MIKKLFSVNFELILALVLALLTYILFFNKVFSSSYGFWGSDMVTQYYPMRVLFYDAVLKGHYFPFWSEKLFSGFPIYADMENSYLNPFNVLGILIFGPMLSYKVLHLASYLIGSAFLYLLLKRKGVNVWGFFLANTVFYFGFFMLNHQVHQNIMMTVYLTPLHFYLLDKFIFDKKFKYIILQALALANIIFWGHIQFVLIMLIGLFLYSISHLTEISIKKLLVYFALTGVFSFLFSAPLLLPNYSLYQNSYRDGGVSALQGSLMPNAAGVTFYPFLFGTWDKFVGPNVGFRFTYTEIYTYVGISFLIFSGFALIFSKKDSLYKFAYLSLWFFILVAFAQYQEFIYLNKLPIISLFRYWVRFIFIVSFALGILVSRFASEINIPFTRKSILNGLLLLIAPIAYIIFIAYLGQSVGISSMSGYLKETDFNKLDPLNFKYWTIILSSSILLGIVHLILNFKKFKWINYAVIIFSALTLFDLFYFSKDVVSHRLLKLSIIEPKTKIPSELSGRRIVLRSGIVGNQYYFQDAWSPFGYSNFVKNNYMELLLESNIDNYKHIINRSSNTYEDVKNYRNLGIVAVYQPRDKASESTYIILDSSPLGDLLVNPDPASKVLERCDHGSFVFEIKNNQQEVIKTFIKSDSGWKLLIDGKPAVIDNSDVFLKFNLASGDHRVELNYFPSVFYYGLILAGFGFVFAYLLNRFGIISKLLSDK